MEASIWPWACPPYGSDSYYSCDNMPNPPSPSGGWLRYRNYMTAGLVNPPHSKMVGVTVSNNSNFFFKIGLKSSPKNVQNWVAEYGN